MKPALPVTLLIAASLLIACDPGGGDRKNDDDPRETGADSAAEGDADADGDADSDADGDSDADSDSDGDADADADLACRGFSASSTEWTLPTITGDFTGGAAFYSTGVSQTRTVGGKSLYYYATTFDLTGDGLSDLVLTYDQVDANVGNKYWRSYKGGVTALLDHGEQVDLTDDHRGLHGRRGVLLNGGQPNPHGRQQVVVLLRHDL
ncbi:MAG: hypothetical protein IPI35_18310 [Deltaproteobacteria bacterium]|nr:hypothetical protein [Deltaproteobacteria bacterium]